MRVLAFLVATLVGATAYAGGADPPPVESSVSSGAGGQHRALLDPTTGTVTSDNFLEVTVPATTLQAVADAAVDKQQRSIAMAAPTNEDPHVYLLMRADVDGVPVFIEWSSESLSHEPVGAAATLPLRVPLDALAVRPSQFDHGAVPFEVALQTSIESTRSSPNRCKVGQACYWRGDPKLCTTTVVSAPEVASAPEAISAPEPTVAMAAPTQFLGFWTPTRYTPRAVVQNPGPVVALESDCSNFRSPHATRIGYSISTPIVYAGGGGGPVDPPKPPCGGW
jgi:hypothetical protein